MLVREFQIEMGCLVVLADGQLFIGIIIMELPASVFTRGFLLWSILIFFLSLCGELHICKRPGGSTNE